MAGVWAVASEIRFASNGVALFQELAAATREAAAAIDLLNAATKTFAEMNATLPRGIGRTTGAFARQTTRVNETALALERYTVAARAAGGVQGPVGRYGPAGAAGGRGGSVMGRVGLVGGVASAVALGVGIKGAADLQNSALQTGIATGRVGSNIDQTLGNMQSTINLAYRMSSLTGGSVTGMMRVVEQMATSGLTREQLTTLAKPIAQFTDILHYDDKNKLSFEKAATLGAGAAHSLQLFTADDLKYGLGRIGQLGYQSPHGTEQLMTQLRLFAPMFEQFLPGTGKQKANQIIEYTAWMDRLGVLQRGGAGLNMLATYLQNPKTKGQAQMLYDFGVTDKAGHNKFRDMRTGQFNIAGALEQIFTKYEHSDHKGQLQDDMNQLSRNAARYGINFTTENAMTALRNIRAQAKQMGDPARWLDATQTQLMQTLTHAWGRFTTNVSTLLTTLAFPAIKPLGKFVGALADATSALTDFLRAHPRATQVGFGALVAGTGVGAYQGLRLLIRHFGGHDSVLLGEIAGRMGIGGGAGRTAATAVTGIGRVRAVGSVIGGLAGAVGGSMGLSRVIMPAMRGILPAILPSFGMSPTALSGLAFGFGSLGRNMVLARIGLLGAGAAAGAVVGPIAIFAAEALLLADLLRNLPNIYIAVGTWWARNSQGLAYTIGFGVGAVAKMLVTAIKNLWEGLKAAALFFLGHPGDFQGALKTMNDAQMNAARRDGRALGAMFGAGLTDAANGFEYGRSKNAFRPGVKNGGTAFAQDRINRLPKLDVGVKLLSPPIPPTPPAIVTINVTGVANAEAAKNISDAVKNHLQTPGPPLRNRSTSPRLPAILTTPLGAWH